MFKLIHSFQVELNFHSTQLSFYSTVTQLNLTLIYDSSSSITKTTNSDLGFEDGPVPPDAGGAQPFGALPAIRLYPRNSGQWQPNRQVLGPPDRAVPEFLPGPPGRRSVPAVPGECAGDGKQRQNHQPLGLEDGTPSREDPAGPLQLDHLPAVGRPQTREWQLRQPPDVLGPAAHGVTEFCLEYKQQWH